MIIWDSPEQVNQFIGQHGGGYCFPGSFQALGWVNPQGVLTAGLSFHDSNGASCRVNIALSEKTFPLGLLKAGFFYVFRQLKLKRLTFTIHSANIPSQELVRRLGAIHEATLRDAEPTGDTLIYALFPEDCKLWSRINGQVSRRNAASAGPGGDNPAANRSE